MLIPHLPTEAVTTWTPLINAHNSDSHGSSANVFLICGESCSAARGLWLIKQHEGVSPNSKSTSCVSHTIPTRRVWLIHSGGDALPQELGSSNDGPRSRAT